MTVTEQIIAGMKAGEEAYSQIRDQIRSEMAGSESAAGDAASGRSELAACDNVDYMSDLLRRGYKGAFSVLYIDPPFFTRSKFNASVTVKSTDGSSHRIRQLVFDDRFERSIECYIENMTLRLMLMRDLLADDGLLWVHLDWHSSHYVKLVLDEIMGTENFVNEIIWCYKSGGSGKKHFSRKHDTLLVYSKTKKYHINIPEEKSYNRGFRQYSFKGVREYRDENGWYTLVNMKDVWNIDMVGRTSGERTGYATQKPLELMRRIVESSTSEGDLTGDFFCGSGSFLEAAELSGRRWMGCDNEKLAYSVSRKRLMRRSADFACVNTDWIRSSDGRLDVRVVRSEELENGRRLLKCSLNEFLPDIDMGYIQLNDREFAAEAAADNPVSLIDHLLIDGNFSGEFRADRIIEEGFDDFMIITEGNAAVLAVDVFGREYMAEIV